MSNSSASGAPESSFAANRKTLKSRIEGSMPGIADLKSVTDTLLSGSEVPEETARASFQAACSSMAGAKSSIRDAISLLETRPGTEDDPLTRLHDTLQWGFGEAPMTPQADRKAMWLETKRLNALREKQALESLQKAARFLNKKYGREDDDAFKPPSDVKEEN